MRRNKLTRLRLLPHTQVLSVVTSPPSWFTLAAGQTNLLLVTTLLYHLPGIVTTSTMSSYDDLVAYIHVRAKNGDCSYCTGENSV